MDDQKFDVIIVGAGLAGSSAAYKLAKNGLQVVMIERGRFPGSKNLSGGVLYGNILHQLIPNFWEEAPVERYITNNIVTFMTRDAALNIDFKTQNFTKAPYNAFSVLRSKFDRWLAEKAEAAGALLVPGIRVDKVLKDGEKVIGVIAGDEELRADVVIAADGANSFIAQQVGLQGPIPSPQLAIGVKELIGLPGETIDERFHLSGNDGVAYGMVGYATQGVAGGGFLYTNKESISVGLVFHLDDLVKRGLSPEEVLSDFLEHPLLEPLLRGGKLLEYGSHLVPEGGMGMMPKLFTGGMLVVGDAAGLSLNNGFVVRGMDMAIASGMIASDVIIESKTKNDFSAQCLSRYKNLLEESFVMADMRTFSRAPAFMKNEDLYEGLPKIITGIMHDIYDQQTLPKEHLISVLMENIKKSKMSVIDLAGFGWNGVRSL